MKKILVFFLLIQLGYSASAQFRIGASVGRDNTNLSLNQGSNLPASSLWTSHFMVQLGFGLTEKLNLNFETGFSSRGFVIGEEPIYTSAFPTTSFRVIGLDIMPSLEFRPKSFVGVGVGPFSTINFFEFIKNEDQPWDGTDGGFFEKFDFGIHTYARGYFKFIFVQLGYDIGVVDIVEVNFTDQNGQSIGIAKGQFRDFRIGLGVLFEL